MPMEPPPCGGCGWEERNNDTRSCDAGGTKRRSDAACNDSDGKRVRRSTALLASATVVECASFAEAVEALPRTDCVASLVRRTLDEDISQAFAAYLSSRSRSAWPEAEGLHPLEASVDRVAVIDFSAVGLKHEDGLGAAVAYGRGLPPRFSPAPASARQAIDRMVSVLPAQLADVVSRDASALLLALWTHTGRRQYILKLELVLGDTCQKWHCDRNISRSLITYVGPGTICAHEAGVSRESDGTVEAVDEGSAVQAEVGDLVIMKGGEWEGSLGHGTAHRAPPIGPVPTCEASQHRLVLKVDISQDF